MCSLTSGCLLYQEIKRNYTEQSAFAGLLGILQQQPPNLRCLTSTTDFRSFMFYDAGYDFAHVSFHSEIQADQETFTWNMLFPWTRRRKNSGENTPRLISISPKVHCIIFYWLQQVIQPSPLSLGQARILHETLQVAW